jgi:hypothetical protein
MVLVGNSAAWDSATFCFSALHLSASQALIVDYTKLRENTVKFKIKYFPDFSVSHRIIYTPRGHVQSVGVPIVLSALLILCPYEKIDTKEKNHRQNSHEDT